MLYTSIDPEGCSRNGQLRLRQSGESLTSFSPSPGTVFQQFYQEAGQVVSCKHSVQCAQGKARGRIEGLSAEAMGQDSQPVIVCPGPGGWPTYPRNL